MNKAKFWLAQIALIAIVGLVLGSPALADKPGFAGSGEKPGFAGQTGTPDHANANSDGNNAGGNGGGKPVSDDSSSDVPSCSWDTGPSACTSQNDCDSVFGSGSWNSDTNSCDA